MSEQNGGPNEASEAGSKPDTGPETPLADHIGAEPAIDAREAQAIHDDPPVTSGEAVEPPLTEGEPVEEPLIDNEAREAAAESSAKAEEEEEIAVEPTPAPVAPKPHNNSSIMVAAGVAILGAAAYLGWSQFVAEPESPAPIAMPAPVVAPPRHADAKPDIAPTPAPAEAPKADRGSSSPSPSTKISGPVKGEAPETKAAEGSSAESTLAAKLAATQAALERATQKLQALEGQAAAPKGDARAPSEVGMARAGDASARIVVAQSLLTALRQGDDFTPQVTALQGFDGDSPRILSLRAALNSPSAAKLAADFAALEPKLAKAAAPNSEAPKSEAPKSEAPAAKPQYFGQTFLAYVEARVEKLVKISPADAPDDEQTGERIKRIEQKLLRGDIAGALAERSLLPEPAILLSADWAKGAQVRLDAELAAKAELAEAMEAFGRNKS